MHEKIRRYVHTKTVSLALLGFGHLRTS